MSHTSRQYQPYARCHLGSARVPLRRRGPEAESGPYSYRTGRPDWDDPGVNYHQERVEGNYIYNVRRTNSHEPRNRRGYSPSPMNTKIRNNVEDEPGVTRPKVPESAVFVRGLPSSVREPALKKWFEERLGETDCVSFMKIDRAPLTTATVGFTKVDLADAAVDKCHRQPFMNSPLRLIRQKVECHVESMRTRQEEYESEKIQRQKELNQMLQGRRVVREESDVLD